MRILGHVRYPKIEPKAPKAQLTHTQEVDRAFALIEQAAIKGERCPQSEPFGPLKSTAVYALYAAGRVRGEIFSSNFRRMTILTGPNKGKQTADPPQNCGPPWKVFPRVVALPNADST
jgi:hypothetical protein